MKLVIDRRFWLRGEGNSKSALRRSLDGKMCCLGFLAKVCGASDAQITNRISPSPCDDVAWPEGLLNGGKRETLTTAARELMRINDYYPADPAALSEEEREHSLLLVFMNLGIEVEFIN